MAKLVHYTTKYPPCHGSQTLKRTSGPRYPPQLSKGSWISEKKKAPTFYLVTIFENKLEVETKKNRHPCIYGRTCKILKERNQLKCQNRT